MERYHIGGDVDSRITELAFLNEATGQLRWRTVPTTVPALREALRSVSGRKTFIIEEGTMANWLYGHLHRCVERMIVCDPRRNKLISDDGDKDNRIDARKLAELSRSGLLREVHHNPDPDWAALKGWVALYHDRVHQAVREINKLRALCRSYGVRPARGVLRNPKPRAGWLKQLPRDLAGQLKVLFTAFDATRQGVRQCRAELARRSKKYDVVARWCEHPGMGLIRSVTFLAYMDTPWRFARRSKAWRYCGVGLRRYTTGTDRFGREKPGTLRLAWACNKRLKEVVIGATMTAINLGDNAIAEYYRRAIREGKAPGNARHSAARKLTDRLMAMWKTGSEYSPDLA